MPAFNKNGQVVNLQDRCSVVAQVLSFTGRGGTAIVSAQPLTSATPVSVQANDCQARQGSSAADLCTSINGKQFGTANHPITILGLCTAISGSGNQAQLTLLLNSGLTIVVPAGSVNSDNF
jgi:hypothetical protein